MAKDVEPFMMEEPLMQTTKEFVWKGFEHTTHLKEVKIKANNNSFVHGFGGG